jgi:hypothetical protein
MQPIFRKSDLYFPQPAPLEAAATASSSSSASSSVVPHFIAPHSSAAPLLPSAPTSAFSQPVRAASATSHSQQPFDQENQAALSNPIPAPFAFGSAAPRPSSNPFFNASAGQPAAPMPSHFASAFSKPAAAAAAADMSKPPAAGGHSDAMLVEAPLSALDLNKDSHAYERTAAKDAFAFGARQTNEVVHVYRVDANTRTASSAFTGAGSAAPKSQQPQHQQPADAAWSHAVPHSQAAAAFAPKPFASAESSAAAAGRPLDAAANAARYIICLAFLHTSC